jgi:hypothetical protein
MKPFCRKAFGARQFQCAGRTYYNPMTNDLQLQNAAIIIEHPRIGFVCQSLEVKMAMNSGFAKGYAKSSEFGILLESIQPATTASNEIHQSTHVPLPPQFGSFGPCLGTSPLGHLFQGRTPCGQLCSSL